MQWTAQWIALPDVVADAVVEYQLNCDRVIDTLHVTADQRFVLYADEVEIARGPTRGSIEAWAYHTVPLARHVGRLRAVVWSLRDAVAPLAQQAQWHGFLLQADSCDTGSAAWTGRRLGGYRFEPMPPPYNVSFPGGVEIRDASVPAGPWETPIHRGKASEVWGDYGERFGHRLVPNPLLPMLDQPWHRQRVRCVDDRDASEPFGTYGDVGPWQALLDTGEPVTLPPHSRVRLLIDCGDYVCGYDRTAVSGDGTRVRIGWQESLADADGGRDDKGHRDDIDGKVMRGRWNTLHVGAEPITHRPLWWTSGRYRCVVIETAEEPATVSALDIIETRYPLELQSTQTLDAKTDALVPMCFRTVQCCAHETYMDCPHYEQMQYVGDTRIQALVSYACVGDDRLARHALRSYANSTTADGLVRARFPDRHTQTIPQFSLYWIALLHDFMMWRDDPRLVRELMPTVRTVCEAFLARRRRDGLVDWPEGWNWVDWQPAWPHGNPPGADRGLPSGINHWQLVYVLGLAAHLEHIVGERCLANRLSAAADDLAAATHGTFWNDSVGAWADTREGNTFSEHAQCFAILSGMRNHPYFAGRAGALLDDRAGVVRGSFYFQHYVFEALHTLGRGGEVAQRLGPWHAMAQRGLRTTSEHADPVRSDCHAWSAHPLLHLHTTLAGIRPAAPGFAKVAVNPTVPNVHVRTMHPRGVIEVRVVDGVVRTTLPDGVKAAG